MEARTTKAEQGEATRATILRAARELFTEHGYGGVGTEEIVRRAKLTRGALYHHFADKKDLFRAVHEQIEGEVMEAIGTRMATAEGDPFALLVIGTRAYLDVCTDPAITRITLVDAPSVLGWEEWREIDLRHGLGIVIAGLQGGMDAGVLRPQPVRPLAHLMLGAMGEAGMVIANAADPDAARAEVEPALLGLLDGLRVAT
ncbi:MAG TPA: TetR/AcrR family transcriptional regulator [Thermoleophilaceae bacterium]|nr:TetR/AcrR family transcriptional regulator [Thermoleophilaceae bacterium]